MPTLFRKKAYPANYAAFYIKAVTNAMNNINSAKLISLYDKPVSGMVFVEVLGDKNKFIGGVIFSLDNGTYYNIGYVAHKIRMKLNPVTLLQLPGEENYVDSSGRLKGTVDPTFIAAMFSGLSTADSCGIDKNFKSKVVKDTALLSTNFYAQWPFTFSSTADVPNELFNRNNKRSRSNLSFL